MSNSIGKKIMIARKKKGITQTELSKLTFVSKSTVSNWEKGYVEPKIDTLRDIANALDCTFAYLVNGDNKKSVKDEPSSEFSQSVSYSPFNFEWRIKSNILLLSFVISSIVGLILSNVGLMVASAILLAVYILIIIFGSTVNTKNDLPVIHYPIGEKLVFVHSKLQHEIEKFSSGHRGGIVVQLIILVLSWFIVIGSSGGEFSQNTAEYMVLVPVGKLFWILVLFFDSFRTLDLDKQIDYRESRKLFGVYLYDFNLYLSILYYSISVIALFTYVRMRENVFVFTFCVVFLILYLIQAWSMKISFERFVSEYSLNSFNAKNGKYTCLEELE